MITRTRTTALLFAIWPTVALATPKPTPKAHVHTTACDIEDVSLTGEASAVWDGERIILRGAQKVRTSYVVRIEAHFGPLVRVVYDSVHELDPAQATNITPKLERALGLHEAQREHPTVLVAEVRELTEDGELGHRFEALASRYLVRTKKGHRLEKVAPQSRQLAKILEDVRHLDVIKDNDIVTIAPPVFVDSMATEKEVSR